MHVCIISRDCHVVQRCRAGTSLSASLVWTRLLWSPVLGLAFALVKSLILTAEHLWWRGISSKVLKRMCSSFNDRFE
jgi:hypothetical protein